MAREHNFHTVIPVLLVVNGEIPKLPTPLKSMHCCNVKSGSQEEIEEEIKSVVGGLLTARDKIRSRAELECRTSRKRARSPELSNASSDPLREALEKVKSYEQADLLRERSVEEIQIILLRHYLLRDERDPGNPTR